MASQAVLDAAASTKTEAQARELRALKGAAIEAQRAFYDHKFDGDKDDIDAMIAFDMEENRLLRASVTAKSAYDAALKVAMEQVAA